MTRQQRLEFEQYKNGLQLVRGFQYTTRGTLMGPYSLEIKANVEIVLLLSGPRCAECTNR